MLFPILLIMHFSRCRSEIPLSVADEKEWGGREKKIVGRGIVFDDLLGIRLSSTAVHFDYVCFPDFSKETMGKHFKIAYNNKYFSSQSATMGFICMESKRQEHIDITTHNTEEQFSWDIENTVIQLASLVEGRKKKQQK